MNNTKYIPAAKLRQRWYRGMGQRGSLGDGGGREAGASAGAACRKKPKLIAVAVIEGGGSLRQLGRASAGAACRGRTRAKARPNWRSDERDFSLLVGLLGGKGQGSRSTLGQVIHIRARSSLSD